MLPVLSVSPVTAILRKLKQQSRENVEEKRPKLLKALREVRISGGLKNGFVAVAVLLHHQTLCFTVFIQILYK